MAEPHSNKQTMTLNDFPDHLLLYIISFLPIVDAVRTTAVSHKWRNLWTSMTSLNFIFDLFPRSNSNHLTRHRFTNFVNRTLILRSHSPVTQFRFQFDFTKTDFTSHVDLWIQYAIKQNTIELDISFWVSEVYSDDDDLDDDEFLWYDFRFNLLKNSRVRVFRLCCSQLILPHNISSTKYPSITSMSLDRVCLQDEMVSILILACVNLESLLLKDIHGLDNIRICSLKLKRLVLQQIDMENVGGELFEICAPNLLSITIDCIKCDKYMIKDSPSLVEARVSFPYNDLKYYKYWSKIVKLFTEVKRLTVQNWWWFKFLGEKDVSLERFTLNNLNHLELNMGYTKSNLLGIAALLNVCPNLSTMVLEYLPKADEDERVSEEQLNKPIKLSLPNLKQVKMKNFRAFKNEFKILKLFKKQGVVLEKMVVLTSFGSICWTIQEGKILEGQLLEY